MDWIALLGRILMSAIFFHGGYIKATTPTATMAYLAAQHLPLVGGAYALSLLVEIGGGLLFLVGYRARLTALALAAWCLATAWVAHYHPESREAMFHFLKNVCMAGGFLQVVAYGAGRISVDRG
nr:DoxX family protein [Rhodopila globiformis]